MSLDIVILGLSITSSWGNGHATTYRSLVRALDERGHRVLFLERDVPWYAENRDLAEPPFGRTALYGGLDELDDRFSAAVAAADLVVVGSFVPDGRAVAAWVQARARGMTAFYDIDTPATLAAVAADRCEYLDRSLIPLFDLYLSFTGGPTLRRLEREFGARRARPLYCSFDGQLYFPSRCEPRWDLGYMGTFSADRQPALERLLLGPAGQLPQRRFVVAGPLYPEGLTWPENVERIQHLAPAEHRAFYCAQRFTLNITRADMVAAGHSPSVRLFEAAACAVPIISDPWPGLDTLFAPGREILVARGPEDTIAALSTVSPEEALRIGARARARVLAEHTAHHRAEELERHVAAAWRASGLRPRLVAQKQRGLG
jgi:spore maturation protein CgeB